LVQFSSSTLKLCGFSPFNQISYAFHDSLFVYIETKMCQMV